MHACMDSEYVRDKKGLLEFLSLAQLGADAKQWRGHGVTHDDDIKQSKQSAYKK